MKARQEGFTIIEVIVAIVLLAITLTTLAGVSIAAAQMAVRNSDASTRQALSLEATNRFLTLPWSAVLAANNSCEIVGPDGRTENPPASNRYQRCIQAVQNGRNATVRVIVTAQQRSQRADTMTFVRMAPPPP